MRAARVAQADAMRTPGAGTSRLSLADVPPLPDDAAVYVDTKNDYIVCDHADNRWRFRYGKLLAFFRYRVNPRPSDNIWAACYIAPEHAR